MYVWKASSAEEKTARVSCVWMPRGTGADVELHFQSRLVPNSGMTDKSLAPMYIDDYSFRSRETLAI